MNKRVLLYVPGIRPSEANSAVRIAELIAASGSIHGDGDYSVRLDPRRGGSVLNQVGEPVLEVVDVPYADQLHWGETGPPTSGVKALVRSTRYAVLSLLRLVLASGRPAKSAKTKLQLLWGLVVVLLLLATVVMVAIAVLAAAKPDWLPGWFPDWLTSEKSGPRIVWGATGVTLGALYLSFRTKVLEADRQLRAIMRYAERPRNRDSVANMVNLAIDREVDLAAKAGTKVDIYLLGYSFGCLVILDALFPRVGANVLNQARKDAIRSLVTVGCPVDLVRLYYPKHFENRAPLVADLPWTNLFIPADIIASNFLDSGDYDGFTQQPDIAAFQIGGLQPTESIAVNDEKLSWPMLLSLDGFELHGGYWDAATRTSYLEPAIPTWLPAAVL